MLTDLADLLRSARLPVVESPGWDTTALPGPWVPVAVLWTSHGDSPREGPPGNARVTRDGTWWVYAAGRTNHAGPGGGYGPIGHDDADRLSIGIDLEPPPAGRTFSAVQWISARHGTAVLCHHLGIDPGRGVVALREYTAGASPDPIGMNMHTERRMIRTIVDVIREDV